MPSQLVGDLEADRLGVVDLLVGIFLQAALAEIPRRSGLRAGCNSRKPWRAPWRCVSANRWKRDRRVADIADDFVLDGEEWLARRSKCVRRKVRSVAIVIFRASPGHRRRRAASFLPAATPAYSGQESFTVEAGRGHPAEFGVEWSCGLPEGASTGTIGGRGGVDGFAELAPATGRRCAPPFSDDRCTDQARGVDLDPRRRGDGGFAVDDGRRWWPAGPAWSGDGALIAPVLRARSAGVAVEGAVPAAPVCRGFLPCSLWACCAASLLLHLRITL